jgi:membrane-associated phospholipid phosphatase
MTAGEPRRIVIGRSFWLWSIGGTIAALAVGAVYAEYVKQLAGWEHGVTWEVLVLRRVHTTLPRALDWMVLFAPWLGTNLTILPGIAIASWRLRKQRRNDLIVAMIVAAAGNYIVGFALKFAFDRPRPDLWSGRGEFTGPSYPSGHAMMATSVLFIAAYLLRREKGWRWPYAVSAVFGAITIYSRLYLGVHWPTDVVAGMVVGLVWLAAMMRALGNPVGTDLAFRAGDRCSDPDTPSHPRSIRADGAVS